MQIHNLHVGTDAFEFIRVVEACIEVLQGERRTGSIHDAKINSGLIELQVPERLVVVSDLHGDIRTLFRILHEIKAEDFLLNCNNKIVFLGDYGDRGIDSIGVLYAICYLKQSYPHSVFLMRGNHEAPNEFPFSSHDLPTRMVERFGTYSGRLVYEKTLSLYGLLPLLTIIQGRLLLVHGGLPAKIPKDYRLVVAAAAENRGYDETLEELLWNDPRSDIQHGLWEKSRRGFGKHFGAGITKRWLEVTGTKVVVRGHEPCKGFRIEHDGMMMTLFSCKESYPKFEAGYLLITGDQLQSIHNASDLASYVRILDK